jgi:hypothetical protein
MDGRVLWPARHVRHNLVRAMKQQNNPLRWTATFALLTPHGIELAPRGWVVPHRVVHQAFLHS